MSAVVRGMRYVTASPSAVRLVNFGGFKLVKDEAQQHNARAAINFGFFSMSKNHPKDSYPVGLLIDQGAVITWPNDESKHFCGVYRKDGKVIVSEVIPPDADWAITAGPRLLQGGQVCERSVGDARWVSGGIGPTRTDVARVAIGVRADGQVVLAFWSGASIRQMAADLLALGCVDALAGDGGGSGSWHDSEHPEDGVSLRAVPNMVWVETEMAGDKDEAAEEKPEPQGGDKPMIVCIDPGHGGPDPGALNVTLGLREKDITLEVSKRLAEYLRRAGAQAILTRDKDTDLAPGLDDKEEMRARAKVANDAKADYLVSVHANAVTDPNANGIEVSYWPGSVRGEALAKSILDAMHVAGGLPKRRVFGQSLLLHSYGDMVTVTAEIGFVTNKVDGTLLGQAAYLDKVALGIAYGILNARA